LTPSVVLAALNKRPETERWKGREKCPEGRDLGIRGIDGYVWEIEAGRCGGSTLGHTDKKTSSGSVEV
jgi:hypothetical protein